MAAKKRGAKRTKRAVKPAKRKVAAKAKKGAAKRKPAASRSAKRPVKRAPAGRAVKRAKPGKAAAPNPPAPVTVATLQIVQLEPLRSEASAAFARGETVLLKTGTNEEGGRVETLVFAPSWKAAQSAGTFVHRGDWSGERLVTDKGHLLDLDGNCFCRECEAAGGYTVDDDE